MSNAKHLAKRRLRYFLLEGRMEYLPCLWLLLLIVKFGESMTNPNGTIGPMDDEQITGTEETIGSVGFESIFTHLEIISNGRAI